MLYTNQKLISNLFPPQLDLLLFEVSAVLFVEQHQVQYVLGVHTIIDVLVAWGQVRRGQVEPHGDHLSLDGGTVHDLKLGERLILSDGLGPVAYCLPLDQAELHLFNLDANEVEIDLALDAVLQMKLTISELKFNMETVLDTDLHLDGRVQLRLLIQVLNDELFLLGNLGVVAIDDDVDVVLDANHYPIVAFELLFSSIELEVVGMVIRQGARRLQVSDKLQEGRVLVLVDHVLDLSDQLDPDAKVVKLLALV